MKLTSLQNPIVKHLVRLRKESGYREEHDTVVVEGLKPVRELSKDIVNLFFTQAYAHLIHDLKGTHWEVTESILEKISGMEHPEGVLAEVKRPPIVPLEEENFVVAFDAVSDPGNMGTLLRTAAALGWEAAFLLSGGCDPFNEKALRAGRGAQFKIKLSQGSPDDLLQWAHRKRIDLLTADITGLPFDQVSPNKARILILGNEAHGINAAIKAAATPITIPMEGKMESLNVAIAGGILLYFLKNQGIDTRR